MRARFDLSASIRAVLSENPAAVAFASDCAAYLLGRALLAGDGQKPQMEAIAAHEAGHAVVMAALGIEPGRAEIFKRRGHYGGLVTPKAEKYEPFLTLESIGRVMCVSLSGYVGELMSGMDRLTHAAHEIGVAFYLAKAAEVNYAGITARGALRATLSECKRILTEHEGQRRELERLLLERGAIESEELDACLKGVKRVSSDRWAALVLAGGGLEEYPAIEGAQVIAHTLALAPQNYAAQIPKPVARMALAEVEKHAQAALLFSGGKDSIALAHLLKPYRERLTLLWVNTGAMFPHMAEFVRAFAKAHGYRLAELHSDQAARFNAYGLPSRIIPVFNTRAAMAAEECPKPRLLLTDPGACCLDLRSKPAMEWMRLNGIKAVIHGQRAQDAGRPQFVGQVVEIAPLWDWSDAEVYGYLEANALTLPEQYAGGYANSGECWNCTAEIDGHRFNWMAKRYPELLKKLVPMIADVYGAANDEIDRLKPGLGVAVAGYKGQSPPVVNV